jgi:hypothetical protein
MIGSNLRYKRGKQWLDSRLIARRLSGIRYAVVGSRLLLKRIGRSKRPQDLDHYPCVFFCYPDTETPFPTPRKIDYFIFLVFLGFLLCIIIFEAGASSFGFSSWCSCLIIYIIIKN